MRVSYDTMLQEFKRVLMKKGFQEDRAEAAAAIFAQNSLAGVYSHGLNRFPKVVEYLEKGEIDPDIKATCELQLGAYERWNGHRGFGPLNARQAMERACELAKQYGIGMVALVITITGCVVGAMGFRQRMPGASVSACQIQSRICLHGVVRIRESEIIHWYLRFRAAMGNT